MLTRTSIFSKTFLLILLSFLLTSNCYSGSERAKHGMVVSESTLASEIGVSILKQGGNAVDAAVAVGFAMAVTYPEAGNIGGGGFMVIHLADGKNTSIDFREKAPLKAYRKMFLDKNGDFDESLSTKGWTSSGVPGSVAGLLYALQKYGTMSIEQVIQPAIELAKNGFPVKYWMAEDLDYYLDELKNYDATLKIYAPNGDFLVENDLLIQSDLAHTLNLIKVNGRDGFYSGETAKKIVKQSNKNNGYITLQDLGNYEPVERDPVVGTYKGLDIVSMGPPSSGGVALIETLNALDNFSFDKTEWNGSRYIHTLVEILKHVYADRSKHLGDSDFYDVPVNELLSKKYGKVIADEVTGKAMPSENISAVKLSVMESNETTHYNVIDKNGNAVSVTTTLNGIFGNKSIVEDAGFFMNNEMDDFSSQPGVPNQYGLIGGEANSIEPGKRMLSSMTPVIILKNKKPYLLVGGRGGSRIITSVLQVILNVVNFEMDIQKAVNVPRVHHQWLPDRIDFNEFALSEDVRENLIAMGHHIGEEKLLAKVLAILVDNNGIIWGAADPRGEGKAIGY